MKKENDKGISAGMAMAWLSYNNEQYYDALRTYKKLYKKAPGNAQLNYRIGMCFVELQKMDTAIFHLKKAVSLDSTINSKVYYALGRAYQYNGDLDKAIDNYYKYKSTLSPKQDERHFVNVYLRQCLTAKDLMANPVNVKIKNLGKAINSKYVDAAPSITADGKTLIFTSRRKENIGGKIDPATEDYYDDVWISHWNDETKTWEKAENIGKPINTEFYDGNLSIAPDGNKIFVYRNQLNVTKSGDIYVSKKKSDGTWGRPRNIDDKNINTSYFESSACITADGKTLYFVSERERGGLGQGDIYKAEKEGYIQSGKKVKSRQSPSSSYPIFLFLLSLELSSRTLHTPFLKSIWKRVL
jgi:tetratricopeptide (TPR) repeat protein